MKKIVLRYCLSDLGSRLRKQNLWPPREADGKTLREFIEAAGDGDLVIVRDKNSPAYVAVATAASKPIIEQWIDRRNHATATVPDLDALPRSVILAFCVQVDPGQAVLLRKTPPFRYEQSPPEEA